MIIRIKAGSHSLSVLFKSIMYRLANGEGNRRKKYSCAFGDVYLLPAFPRLPVLLLTLVFSLRHTYKDVRYYLYFQINFRLFLLLAERKQTAIIRQYVYLV